MGIIFTFGGLQVEAVLVSHPLQVCDSPRQIDMRLLLVLELISTFWIGKEHLKLITPHDGLGIDRSVDRIDRSGCQVGGSNI